SPGLDISIVAECLAAGLPPLPGVSTASELQIALGLGLRWVKVFPAAVLGPSWFSILRGPFPEMRFVATGGLTAASASEFLAAGVRVVAVGSATENDAELAALAGILAPGS
ncbi:MAG TPA: bifunctional 4-hydroxy-2-oxoglutarate aldolase/2-dehydro-3-deoxy-phosphogluconate aldolase, partial [Galbitalea sp.]|nr:bifunctional 4-hydroxy-2-oxoglutarate aldolase/2-dehydro-3-deoxy-phosphogluconate aldolase [Galbitalea sp.]